VEWHPIHPVEVQSQHFLEVHLWGLAQLVVTQGKVLVK